MSSTSGDKKKRPSERDPDERVRIPLDPNDALRGLLAINPDDEPESPPVEGPDTETLD